MMGSVGSYAIEDGIGIVTIDSPPVNALGTPMRRALEEGVRRFAGDDAVRAIILIGAGRAFCAGADIAELGRPFDAPVPIDLLAMIEAVEKPVVAAIHGTALGGGFELALACHYRIATSSAKLGLPEVSLGLLPGAGGTQRVPRVIGVEAALDLMTGGRPIGAARALELGLIDALADDGRLKEEAIAFAHSILGRPVPRIRDRQDRIAEAHGRPEIFADYRAEHARAFRGLKAPEAIVQAVEAAVALPFDAGLAREQALFEDLLRSTESAAQRHYFFAERETAKIPDIPADTPALPIASVGVIGAGTMGGGITMNFLNAGIPVTLVETNAEALERGIATIRRNYEATAAKGRMTIAEVERRMGLITPALTLEVLDSADLVIEAVFEQMAIKKALFATLDGIAREGAILASNTSFLNLDEIAGATRRPEWVIGLHFFSPANVMRLLEVVRGARTSPEVIATAMKLARAIGKVPVLSRVCHGFIANRLMAPRGDQADALVLEGPTPEAIDAAMYDYGFAMGPFRMIDLVGLDVIGRDDTTRSVRGDLVAMGRLGQKRNGGYYDYDAARRATPSPVAAGLIADFARSQGIADKGPLPDGAIVERLLYPVVNEGAKLLEEGIALRASDIDVAAILGYNWPAYTGGPMFWADTVGLPEIVAALKALAAEHGPAFAPARLLEEKAATGGSFTR